MDATKFLVMSGLPPDLINLKLGLSPKNLKFGQNDLKLCKGSGTLSIPKCPKETHVLDMWSNCPHPYTSFHVPSRAFWMSYICYTSQWVENPNPKFI